MKDKLLFPFVIAFLLISLAVVWYAQRPRLVGGDLLTTPLKEVKPIVETKTGDFAYNEFKDVETGEIIKETISIEDYRKLGEKNASQPKKDGYVWVGASAGNVIATSVPVLNDYEYYKSGKDEASSSLITIKIPDKKESVIKESEIVDGKLTQSIIDKIE